MIVRRWNLSTCVVLCVAIMLLSEFFGSVRLVTTLTSNLIFDVSNGWGVMPSAVNDQRGQVSKNALPNISSYNTANLTNTELGEGTSPPAQMPLFRPLTPPDDSFGACLMVKDDNELLVEWIAYHYTVLPLRYLVIINDSGSSQDPMDVLNRWNSTDLTFWVWQQSKGPITATDRQAAHHQLKARQNVFVLQCTKFMISLNRTWVAHTDPDEYILLNRINAEDEAFRSRQGLPPDAAAFHNKNATVDDFVRLRQSIPPIPSDNYTAIDLLHKARESIPSMAPCVVIQRVRVGALENRTCDDSTMMEAKALVESSGIDYARMTSLRYTQRQDLNDFDTNTWGKVAIDVSRFTDEILRGVKNNVHRAFSICPKPKIPSYEGLLYATHYSGSWERFSERSDARREGSRESFEASYFFDKGSTCEFGVHEWLPRFVRHVGADRARLLLGTT